MSRRFLHLGPKVARRALLTGLVSAPLFSAGASADACENTPQSNHMWRNQGMPSAVGALTACVMQRRGLYSIAYRDGAGEIHWMWRNSAGQTGCERLIERTGAPRAAGDPFMYFNTQSGRENLLFRSHDDHVRGIYFENGAPGSDDLSGHAGAPPASGNPVGYCVHPGAQNHVIYRGRDDNDLHEIAWNGAEPARYTRNLTGAISAPKASGDPSAFSNGTTNIAVYRSDTGEVMGRYWSATEDGVDSLSSVAGTPRAASDPVAYFIRRSNTHQVVYLGVDRNIYELYWQGADRVVGWNVTQAARAPSAAGGRYISFPMSYYCISRNTKHIVYGTPDVRLCAISWTPGVADYCISDLTERYGARPTSGRPAAFTTEGSLATQHVAYRGAQNNVYEVLWQVPQRQCSA